MSMLRVESRQAAHLRSRVKDESRVPNVVSFTGLFSAITPIAKLVKNPETDCYDPILVRDVDSLLANFGDPRIDPEKYVDLYSIMEVVGNGTSCYVCKVDSGDAGIYELSFLSEPNVAKPSEKEADVAEITKAEGHDVNVADKNVVISPLNNRYLISGVSVHYPAISAVDPVDEVPAVAASATVDGLTFTAKEAGSEGNSITVEVVDGSLTDTFTLLVNGSPVEGGTDVTAFDSLADSCPVTATGVPAVTPETTLEGGADKVDAIPGSPAVDEHSEFLTEDDYAIVVDEDDPTTLIIKLEDHVIAGNPDKLMISKAELDPKYGREDIVLTATDDSKVFETSDDNLLDRPYTILEITDGSDVVDSSKYTVKWDIVGEKHKLTVTFDEDVASPVVSDAHRQDLSVMAYSSMSDDIEIRSYLSQAKPYALRLFYLNVEVVYNNSVLASSKVKLLDTTTNQGLVNNLNSNLGSFVHFELADTTYASASGVGDMRDYSIAYQLLETYAQKVGAQRRNLSTNPQPLPAQSTITKPSFKVKLQNYIDAANQYNDRRYNGCLLADFTCPVTHSYNEETEQDEPVIPSDPKATLPLSPEERRALHYTLKMVANERKDANVILSVPYFTSYKDQTPLTLDEVCDWVAARGDFSELWDYGATPTTDYSIQSFYLEIYYSWLNQQCTKLQNGLAKPVMVKTAPANIVVNNILTSFRERGVQYPVAGDQYGTLSSSCSILQNPKTQLERDQLVQYRINPIWDTGLRGIQIYGNETLNAGYTDLNAAHAARTLVYIRSKVDEYTETLKFLINSKFIWDTWKNYVSDKILKPLQDTNALSEFSLAMGSDTTSRAEIANRQINGVINLRFYASLEIIDLTFVVYSSATTLDEAGVSTQ